jgi:hypothetical protein
MILVLGHPDDALTREVSRRLAGGGMPMLCRGEPELFSETSFAFEQSRSGSGGTLRVGDTTVHLNEVSGVLMRLPRLWWPSADFDLQDQTFVYHECSAAWFALLASLGCPVVNRFDLAWWLNDVTYPDALAHDLGQRLHMPTRIDPPPDPLPPRILPTMPGKAYSSVYLAGQALLPREAGDQAARNWLQRYLPGLAHWQRESGVHLCRLDFEAEGNSFFLKHIEIFPLLDEEPPALLDRITDATVEMLA